MDNIKKNADGTYSHYQTEVYARNKQNAAINWTGMVPNDQVAIFEPKGTTEAIKIIVLKEPRLTRDTIQAGMIEMAEIVPSGERVDTNRKCYFEDEMTYDIR